MKFKPYSNPWSGDTSASPIMRWVAGCLQRWTYLRLSRTAARRVICDVPVGFVTGEFAEAQVCGALAGGLELLKQYQPDVIARLREQTEGILVWEATTGVAAWHHGARLVIVDTRFLCASGTDSTQIAATLVHEATHARLDRFGYAAGRRARIEAICFRRERAFARRLPESESLVAAIDRQLQRDPSYWTDDASRQRVTDELIKLGVPARVVRIIQLISGRRDRHVDSGN